MGSIDLSAARDYIASQPDGAITRAKRAEARDAGIESLLSAIAEFVAECETNPEYCGTMIDEQRDQDGKLLSMRLVPCDLIGGVAARRTA